MSDDPTPAEVLDAADDPWAEPGSFDSVKALDALTAAGYKVIRADSELAEFVLDPLARRIAELLRLHRQAEAKLDRIAEVVGLYTGSQGANPTAEKAMLQIESILRGGRR